MSEKGLFLQFVVTNKETKFGQEVYVVGSPKELGEWEPKNSQKLSAKDIFPLWESDYIKFDKGLTVLEYKYIVVTNNNFNDDKIWEFKGCNRKLDLSKYEEGCLVIKDFEFSQRTEPEILTIEEYEGKYKNKKENNINNINNYEKNENNISEDDQKDLGNSGEIQLQQTNKIGLQNIGSTCYMNATLQCFCHIAKFISFFKKVNSNNLSNNSLSISFKHLIDSIWKDDLSPSQIDNNYYIPTDFRQKLANKSALFQNNEANDAKDLVNFIIMTLHEELNKVKNNIININNILIDQTQKESVFQNFVNEFQKHNQSIISDLFYAMNLSVTQCTFCHNKLYNYQIYYFIVFPLEEVRKFKYQKNFNNNYQFFNMNNMNNMNYSNEVSIYDCFDYDQKINYMIGQNKMYCNYCKNNTDCTMITTLVTGPDVLILLLNRGKGLEFNVKINFVEYLNLEKYIEIKKTGFNYELFGVITHIGENGQGGHFIAYCRDPFTNVWSKFNDAIVTEVNDFQSEILNFANPYLLFYQKLKT